ncbi:1,4-dihydroxy-6-naphthoate synthase [Desulfovibrio sp.]|uniref:1,4-dihydroxy-6-naphthoate synthase n=1 Tax=Desulfovibrio sp. TaxID=885 RepID=UPI0023D13F62|nr:1,4-dihydroxy-6-naphthoate synthase [Desulfovibrio sp.]MDE7240354.1 1,4-dihydroxy-6-naphthoate synthase [Desulfovibrio sp.]
MSAQELTLSLGLSPCPNDTFIFHALLEGRVRVPAPAPWSGHIRFVPHFADVEELNGMAVAGRLDVTKLSLGAVARIMDAYALFSSGAALGWGCGPLVVAAKPLTPEQLKSASVAVPGLMTTANLLLDLHGGFRGPRRELLFSDIMDAVARGEDEAGVIIHEGRFTFGDHGLIKIVDLGEWWESAFHLPLPLGAIAGRRGLPLAVALAVQGGIAESLRHAWAHPEDSRDFIRAHAQELDDAVTKAHIETFVTAFSEDLGPAGREAIATLVERSAARLGVALPAAGLFWPGAAA